MPNLQKLLGIRYGQNLPIKKAALAYPERLFIG